MHIHEERPLFFWGAGEIVGVRQATREIMTSLVKVSIWEKAHKIVVSAVVLVLMPVLSGLVCPPFFFFIYYLFHFHPQILLAHFFLDPVLNKDSCTRTLSP